MIPKLAFPLLAAALVLAGCGSSPAAPPASTSPAASSSAHEDEHDDHDGHDSDEESTNVDAREPRLALTHEGGVMVVNATTLELISDLPVDVGEGALLRLHHSGDPRRALVSNGSTVLTLDLGAWSVAHGDHHDSKITTPKIAGATFTTQKTGHISPNGELTAIFDDGDGSIEIYENAHLDDEAPAPVRTLTVPAHHGNAIPLDNGTLLHTVADGEDPVGIKLIDAQDKTLAESRECPGTHGATVVRGAVLIGCQDGVLLVKDNAITKIKAGPAFARMGNLFGSTESPFALADYKLSSDAAPTEVAIIDTATGSIKTVALPDTYSFRGLAFTDDGKALVLTNDGQLHVIDAASATIEKSIKVIETFTEPTDWTRPRPAIHAQGHWVYVTDPATKKVHGIELSVGKIMVSGTLAHAPNEITGTLG